MVHFATALDFRVGVVQRFPLPIIVLRVANRMTLAKESTRFWRGNPEAS